MTFGIKPETPKYMWWGARAIYESNHDRLTGKDFDRQGPYAFALLWDRQQIEGGTDEEKRAFETWINKKGLPALRKLVKAGCKSRAGFSPDTDREIGTELDGYVIVANPRRSFGYLYIGIYPVKDAENQTSMECPSCSSTRGRRPSGECIDCGGAEKTKEDSNGNSSEKEVARADRGSAR
jgi:hypothetical protein